jgi:endonuclease/exonuclease/phosphatase family metal-dependent hydrolase
MSQIKIAFWNVENLFDATPGDIATDLEFTPAQGWTEEVVEAKLDRLAEVIRTLHGGAGPDLLGLCEVENKPLVERLLAKLGRPELAVAHIESPDVRGIDTSLVYSRDVFRDPPKKDIREHLVYLRFPTRDIFQVRLTLRSGGAELNVLVNHWPSRRLGQYESEPHRMTVAEHCGRLVDQIVKVPKKELLEVPDTDAGLARLAERWDRNVLVMGDLNDEPHSRSVLNYLQGTKDLDHLEEELKPGRNRRTPDPAAYLKRSAYLFNAMWPLLGAADRGTFYFSGSTNSMNLLDQILVSRGLYYGRQGLRLVPGSAAIATPEVMTTPKGRPRPFDRTTRRGYSDHFPITALIETA